jgi:hypothetical protein
MPEMTVRRPVIELDLGDVLGAKPAAVFHICYR